MQAPGAGLRVEVDGPLARLTLATPERRNAQTPELWRALAEVPSALGADVRTVLVDAEGPSFSAGLDRRMLSPEGIPGTPSLLDLAAMPGPEMDRTIAGYQAAFSWLRDDRFVTVAAVQGHAVGAGFQLALACDLRLAADDAQFCMREPSLGLVPDLGGTQPLVEAVGYARALDLCVTGRWMGAEEALGSGLVLGVVPRAGLAEAAARLVASLAVAPVGAVRATKRLLRAALDRPYSEQLAAERAEQAARLADLAALVRGPVGDPVDGPVGGNTETAP